MESTIVEALSLPKISGHVKKLLIFRISLSFLVLGIGYLYWSLYHQTPLLAADSDSYLNFTFGRTPGYPLFLQGVQAIWGTESVVPVIQLILLLISIAYLIDIFYRTSQSAWLSGMMAIGLLGNVELIKYAFLILTESLTATALIFILALLCAWLIEQKNKYLIFISALIGFACLVRPVTYAWLTLFPVLFLMLWAKSLWSWKRAYLIISPCIFCILLGWTVNYHKHGHFSGQSTLGEIIGKVGFLADVRFPTQNGEAMRALQAYSQPVNQVLSLTPSIPALYLMKAVYYDQFRYGDFAMKLNNLLLTDRYPDKSSRSLNQARADLALEILKSNPLAYLQDCGLNYLALWQLWDLKTKEESVQFKTFLDNIGTLPWIGTYPYYPRKKTYDSGRNYVMPIRLGLSFLWVCTLFFPVLILKNVLQKRPNSSEIWLIGAASILVQATYVLTALLQAGLPRYAVIMWPGLAFLGTWILCWFCQRLKQANLMQKVNS